MCVYIFAEILGKSLHWYTIHAIWFNKRERNSLVGWAGLDVSKCLMLVKLLHDI